MDGPETCHPHPNKTAEAIELIITSSQQGIQKLQGSDDQQVFE
jgi:hypothetical protein